MTPELFKSAPRLKRLLPRFRKLRIGVVGDLMVDRYVLGEANRLSMEVPVAVVDYKSQQDVSGGAANVAANTVPNVFSVTNNLRVDNGK